MRKLALPEEVLLQIEQPARYIGNEFNSVVKDKEKVALRGAFLFPDVYEIGMSHLGIQILYDMFNKREDMWCERVYSPWPDLDRVMREQSIPLFGLESQEPVKNEDFLFYESEDADSGMFTYFAFSPDTPESTYHLEFRYAEDLSDLQSWFEGNYAYWNAAAIAVDYDQETMKNVIELFVTENLTEAE